MLLFQAMVNAVMKTKRQTNIFHQLLYLMHFHKRYFYLNYLDLCTLQVKHVTTLIAHEKCKFVELFQQPSYLLFQQPDLFSWIWKDQTSNAAAITSRFT